MPSGPYRHYHQENIGPEATTKGDRIWLSKPYCEGFTAFRNWSVLVTRFAVSQQAALLELLPAAAGTWVVSPNAFERILVGLPKDWINLGLLPPPLLVLAVLLGETIPSGTTRRWCLRKAYIRDRPDGTVRQGARYPA
jgi:hypothetical protein